MRLYHGTGMKFNIPKLEKCNRYTDFGRGFYLTHELERAKEWGKNRNPRKYYVNVYEIVDDYINSLRQQGFSILQFQEASAEWAEFVYRNRLDESFEHHYDIILGPVADNSLQVMFARMLRENISFADIALLIQYKKFKKPQICFCTQRSINQLKYIRRNGYTNGTSR